MLNNALCGATKRLQTELSPCRLHAPLGSLLFSPCFVVSSVRLEHKASKDGAGRVGEHETRLALTVEWGEGVSSVAIILPCGLQQMSTPLYSLLDRKCAKLIFNWPTPERLPPWHEANPSQLMVTDSGLRIKSLLIYVRSVSIPQPRWEGIIARVTLKVYGVRRARAICSQC